MGKPVLAAVAVCALSMSALAQGTFPLTYREASPDDAPVLAMAQRSGARLAEKPPDIRGLPADLPTNVLYYRALLSDRPVFAVTCDGSPVRLYIDTDGDNDLSDEKGVAGTPGGSGVSFGTVGIAVAGAPAVHLHATSHSGADGKAPQCLHLSAGGYRMGDVRVADRTYRVALIDNNLNGRYGDVLRGSFPSRDMDALAIDLDGDGQLQGINTGNPTQEWMPLGKAIAINGAYYRVTVAADGARIQLAKTEPAFGQLDLGPSGVELQAFSDFGFQRVVASGGKTKLPAGLYAPLALTVTHTDEAGVKWTLDRSSNDEKLSTFTIPPDETLSLPVGPPFVAAAEVRQSGQTVSVTFTLRGRSGELYYPAIMRNGVRLRAPDVEVVDDAGKVLRSGKLAYG